MVVESTYNWYWLVDGLQEHGYKGKNCNWQPDRQRRMGALKQFWINTGKSMDIKKS